ncbi:hypothetical protein [Legionella londiniensis]|uniref:Yip1 domain protein n=1 Tax=Legionella londiniensis TaxID=45068 RepID=A0A0W0VNL2_9GAMM|nr:hypothetical protein [Legionella londiniensis]KTD21713.1 hypothetical protein Llon_0878 [Legionella londiniensis]STX93451.1 Uncharacterised protein [Legionella londiniensis]
MWWALIQQYWQICIFKRSPADTPHSHFLLIVVLCLFLFILVMQWEMVDFEQQFSLLSTFAAAISLVISYGLYTFILLYSLNLSNRFIQTVTCLYASHLIVHILAFPLIVATPYLGSEIAPKFAPTLFALLYLLLALSLTIWQFMLAAYIYKKAISTHYFSAVLASFGLLATNMLMVSFWR